MQSLYLKHKINLLSEEKLISFTNNYMIKNKEKNWKGFKGKVLASANGFDVIDNEERGFAHIIPIPDEEELENVYKHDYYEEEKPLYLERYLEDIDWWNDTYSHRYKIFERNLSKNSRSILDIGSGPGYFLLKGKDLGWKVKGIEPSFKAFDHSKGLGLDVEQGFYNEETAPYLGKYDVINLGLVLEHIPYPEKMLGLLKKQLNYDGILCIIVPNDFNPFQILLRDNLNFKDWWVAPPHHINYFNFQSLTRLLEKCGFSVIHQESTFPIDMFLLMGENYLNNDEVGRKCHKKRMNFEKAMRLNEDESLLERLYSDFAKQGIGREIVLYAKK